MLYYFEENVYTTFEKHKSNIILITNNNDYL